MFIINISVNDALMALVAIGRGLGIISKKLIGVDNDDDENELCCVFTIFSSILWLVLSRFGYSMLQIMARTIIKLI